MIIKEVSVTYEQTQSLSGYCNVRPGVRLTAEVGEEENPFICVEHLRHEAKKIVHAEIDEALMHDGQKPVYYSGPTFKVMQDRRAQVFVLLPNEFELSAAPEHTLEYIYGIERKLPPDFALGLADDRLPDGWLLIDCRDGDISRVPVQLKLEENPF